MNKTAGVVDVLPAAPASERMHASALLTLFWLTLRQQCRARRLLILCVLFCLPIGIAVLARSLNPASSELQSDLEFGLIFGFIAHALVPLTALLYASGMIQDDIEEQTLTYLMVRPLPKPAIYLTKLTATIVLTVLIAGVFVVATYVAIDVGRPEFWGEVFPGRALKVACLLGLSLVSYCALFGLVGLLFRRTLFFGVIYIAVFEGALASMDFIVRRLTIMYYFRVLVERWTKLKPSEWSISLSDAPGAQACVAVIVAVAVAASAIAVLIFATREFRVKTPEGN
jgi:ABC-2 type transport system permease protein